MAAAEQYANLAQSTLATGIGSTDAALTIQPSTVAPLAANFPAAPQFRILIDSELMLVTAVSALTFTVSRGIEGTAAASHAFGASVTCVLTKASLLSLATSMNVVLVNATGASGRQASPYTANPGDCVVVDTSLGSVVVILPTLGVSQSVRVKHDENTSLATYTVTVHGPGPDTTLLGQPPPNNAAGFVSPFVFGGSGSGPFAGEAARGMNLTWTNLGGAGGYVLQ